MPTIVQLPPSVVNKIAAGEVIERPASVVKELLENAVDSQAARIDVTVEQGGTALVRVADDGCGIAADQLTLAVASHATSKIRDADDLFRVATLGFRGEALASIAEVSQLRIRSRTAEADAGYELEVNGGVAEPIEPCGCPVGTSIEVRNLFFNTPVRRKFMRTTQTEMGHTTEAFTRIALAYPDKHMTLRHGDRTVYDLPPATGWRERIAAFFGDEVGENLIWIESSDEALDDPARNVPRLSGYVANPQVSRSNNRMQYLFLNGRFIRDRALQHALGEAYRGLLMVGRYPVAFLKLELPAESIDVNVHPTKMEVRFQDGGRIYSQLLGTLRNRFLATDLTATVPASPEPAGQPAGLDGQTLSQHRQSVESWAQGPPPRARHDKPSQQPPLPLPTHTDVPEFIPFGTGNQTSTSVIEPSDAAAGTDNSLSAAPGTAAPCETGRPAATVAGAAGTVRRPSGLQVHNRYLVTEDAEGMVVIDQHALHERILYEQIRTKTLAGDLETQRLLVPSPVSLTPEESAAVLDARDTLLQLGIEVEPFGGATVLVSSYPAMLSSATPQEMLRQVVDLLLAEGQAPERRDLLDELLHMISCKAAIKAGDYLAPEEVDELLLQRHHYQDSHHCPHGRPTALRFSREELDKRFKRT